MKTASSIYKILRTAKTSWYEWQVVRGTTTYGLDRMKSLSVSSMLTGTSGMEVGNANAAECRVTLIEDSANWERMAQFSLQFRICNESGVNKSEWITFGTYYTDVRSEDHQGNLSIIAYDAMMKTERSWVSSIPSASMPTAFPITARAWATLIQNTGLVTFDDITTLDDTVAFVGFNTSTTIRDVLRSIAAVHGGNWFVTPSETYKLIQYENVSASETSRISTLNLSMHRLENSPSFDAVTGVHLETEAGNVMEAGTTDGYVLKSICSVATTVGVAQLCFPKVGGYVYKPFSAWNAYLDPIVDVGDALSINGTIYQLMTAEWTFGKTPTATIAAPFEQEIDHEFVIVDANTQAYRKSLQAVRDATAEFQSYIDQTAEEIKAVASASIHQYDTETYTVELFGYEPPSATQYPPADYDGEYYLNQSDGALYVSDGAQWSFVKNLQLINVKQDAALSTQANEIAAKVSQQGGQNVANSFSWVLTSDGHRWYANGSQTPVVSILGSGVSVTGEIKATSGYIGDSSTGFTIGARSISNGMTSLSDVEHNGVYVGTDGIALGKGNFKVTSSGSVTATNMNITGGSISITDGNGNVIFSANSSGVTVNGNGRFTGTVYAGNIISEQTYAGAGYFNGSGIATGTITGGIASGVATGQLSSGVCQSLGYADFFNAATASGTSTYPTYFTAGSLYATSSVASRVFSVENSSGEEAYHLNDHYHSFTEQNGKIVIGIPHNRASIDDRSFNIADTQTYRDGVAAVTVASRAILYCNASNYNSFDYDCNYTALSSSYLYTSGNVQYGRIEIRNAAGTALKTLRIQIPASSSGSATVSITGAQSSSATNHGVITATATLGDGSTVSDTYDIYLNATANTESAVTMQVIHGTGSSQVVLAERSVTPTAAYNAGVTSAAVTSGSVLTTTAATYGQYDSGFNFGLSGNLYTSGSYQYGRIAIKNAAGTTLKTIRVVIPASSSSITSITVARPYGDMRDWDLSEENHVYVNVNLSALNGSTVLATDTGRVNVDDVVNFWAPHQTRVLATTSVSDSNNYDLDVDTTGYSNAYFKSGNYQYVRFELQNSNGNELGIVRVKTASTDMSISEVTGLTSDSGTYQTYNRQVSFVASSLYTPSGSSTQYARIQVNLSNGTNEVIRVAIPASAGGSVTRANYDSGYYSSSLKYYKYVGTWPNGTGYVRAQCGSTYGDLDVTDLVMEAVRIGQQSGGTTSYYWSDEKTGPYGSKQRDCYFTINGSVVQTAKVIWSSGNPSFQ